MNSKELASYKRRLEHHERAIDVTPCYTIRGFGYESAYLDREAAKKLRTDINERKSRGDIVLEGTNKKATYRKTDKGEIILTSYYTEVAKIYRKRFYKLWQGYSVTTLNHIAP